MTSSPKTTKSESFDGRAAEAQFDRFVGLLLTPAGRRNGSDGHGGRLNIHGDAADEQMEDWTDRAQVSSLAWSLADLARPRLNKSASSWLCAQIGAGEYCSAIENLLTILATHKVQVPSATARQLRLWLSGYVGSDRESVLRTLVEELQVSLAGDQSAMVRRARVTSWPHRTSSIAASEPAKPPHC